MENTLIGLKIVSFEILPKNYLREYGWKKSPIVLVLSNGSRIYANSDSEGNGPGELWVQSFDGDEYTLEYSEVIGEK